MSWYVWAKIIATDHDCVHGFMSAEIISTDYDCVIGFTWAEITSTDYDCLSVCVGGEYVRDRERIWSVIDACATRAD